MPPGVFSCRLSGIAERNSSVKKSLTFLLFLVLLCAVGSAPACAEFSPPETPAPARMHVPPAVTPEPPPILNRIRDPKCLDSVRFHLDVKLLDIWFPDIMNADEAILLYDGEVWLIDCGDEKNGVRGAELLKKLGVTKIDKLFVSHPHHDHINGLAVTDETASVEQLLVCFPPDSTESMIKAMDYAETAGITVKEYEDGDVFAMGDGRVTLKFFCNDDPALDMNNNSAVTLLQHGTRRMLFCADMERPGQAVLTSRVSPEALQADILKYPHHGKSGLMDEFLQAVSPSVAVITNTSVRWGGVEYLSWRMIPYYYTVWYTATANYLHLYTDGSVWVIEYVPVDSVRPRS